MGAKRSRGAPPRPRGRGEAAVRGLHYVPLQPSIQSDARVGVYPQKKQNERGCV